jgi:hypothetical protein
LPVIPAYFLIQKVGRRTILWTCTFGIAIALTAAGLTEIITTKDGRNASGGALSLVFLGLYLILFELSLGPLTWLYCAEIMTEKGLSLASATN